MDTGWKPYVGITQNSDVTVFARIFPWNQRFVKILRVEASRINSESTVVPDCQRDSDYMGVDSRSIYIVGFLSTPLQREHLLHDERIITDLRFYRVLRGYCGATPNDHRFGYSKIDKQHVSMEIFTPNGTSMGFSHIILDSPQHGICQDIFWVCRLFMMPYDAIPGAIVGSRNKHRCGSKRFGTFGIHRTEKWNKNTPLGVSQLVRIQICYCKLRMLFPSEDCIAENISHIYRDNYHNSPPGFSYHWNYLAKA